MNYTSDYHFAYQIEGGRDAWRIAPISQREQIIRETRPRYVSVLTSTQNVAKVGEFNGELRYRGDAYFDFDAKPQDGESVDDAITYATEATQKFVQKLADLGVNPRSLRIYATGGKGFHVEVPEATYAEDAPADYSNLPAILHELAIMLYVDCLDLAVYSRGFRMWRCPNVQRENGRFKVPISYDELMGMTPKLYVEMTAAPRPMPSLDAPTLAQGFGELFCEAEGRVAKIAASKPKAKTVTSHDVLNMSPTSLRYEVVKRSIGVEQFVDDYLEGFWSGGNFKAKNPRRKDRHAGSLVIWPDGSWKEFAEDDVGGGDLISLYANLFADDSQDGALMKLTPPGLDLDAEVSKMKAQAYKATMPANVASTGTLEWLMKQEFKPPKTRIRDLLHTGLMVLVGAPKSGKSWMGLDLALCSAAGMKTMNGAIAEKCGVLFITPDDQNLRRFQQRILQVMHARGIHEVPRGFEFRIEWPRIGGGGIELLAEFLDANPSVELVVIDCLVHILPAVPRGTDRYAAEMAAMASLRKLANDRDISVVALHHTRKAKSDDIFDSTSGTNGINGGADAIAVLSRVRGTQDATLAITGRSVEEAEFGLSLASGVWQVAGPAAAVKLSGARKALVDAIGRCGGVVTAKQLAIATGKDRTTILRVLQDLEAAGLVAADRSTNEHAFALVAA